MHVLMHVYIYVCLCMCVYMCRYACANMCICARVYIYIYVCMYLCLCIRTCSVMFIVLSHLTEKRLHIRSCLFFNRIEHDNTGMAPGWFLDRVSARSSQFAAQSINSFI